MWKRMLEPWLMAFTLVTLLISGGAAHLLVNGFGWRYTDWTGFNSQPFDASGSILAYTLLGAIGWPIALLILWLVISDLVQRYRRHQRRACVGNHS